MAKLHVSMADHPGIIAELSELISSQDLNVSKLETKHELAPISNSDLFSISGLISSQEELSDDKKKTLKAALRAFEVEHGTDVEITENIDLKH